MKYLKNPFNYMGAKYKLLNQIIPLFPKKIDTFVDLFCGSCEVGINITANKIICNDLNTELISILQAFQKYETEEILEKIDDLIKEYNLSTTNKEGYYKLRDYYKNNREWYVLYTLILFSFNNLMRFNLKREFNVPFGKNRSYFTPQLREKLINYSNTLKIKNIIFTNLDFRDFDFSNLTEKDFVYVDPPYFISNMKYDNWEEKDEIDLLNILDELNKKNIKFALSNTLEMKGLEHTILKEWSKNYNVHYLNMNYTNCFYSRKGREYKDIEVLITNY